MMDSLIVPDLAMLRRWLDQLNILYFECDSCQALHLPHMQILMVCSMRKLIW